MDPVAAGTLIAGFLAPLITWTLNRFTSAEAKQLGSLAISLALGVIALAATGGFTESTWGLNLLAVVGTSQALFTLIVKPTDKALAAPTEARDDPRG